MFPARLSRSLRVKITLGTALPLILILGLFTSIEYTRHRKAVLSSLSSLATYSGQVIEASLRHAMLESDFSEVQSILNTIGENDDIQVVYLLDLSGEIMFAPNNVDVGTVLDNTHGDCQPCHGLPVANRPDSIVVGLENGQRIFRSMQPIENTADCARCHDPTAALLGVLLTDISMEPMEAVLSRDLRENLLWSAITVCVAVMVVNLAINRFVLRRLSHMARAMVDLGQGQFSAPLFESNPDEIGQLAGAFNRMARQIQTRETENRLLSDDLRQQSKQQSELLKRLITAQEDERKRVARELHDKLGQSLSGLALHTEALERFIAQDTDRAVQQLGQIRSLTRETTDRMYELILDLRPSVLDDLGLVAALRVYSERLLAETEIAFAIDATRLEKRLPPEIETVLYRICQEALSNIVRHAGAKQITIVLVRRDGIFEGEIVDDGMGFSPENVDLAGQTPRGLGLLGMQERALQCKGQLTIISQPGEGTQVHIRIPLKEDDGD